jgi:hypothetical protein
MSLRNGAFELLSQQRFLVFGFTTYFLSLKTVSRTSKRLSNVSLDQSLNATDQVAHQIQNQGVYLLTLVFPALQIRDKASSWLRDSSSSPILG